MGDEALVNALTADYSAKNYNYKFMLIVVAIGLGIIGSANLRSPKQGDTNNLVGVDVMVALDVSNSMMAQDIKPNRLERAKQVLGKIVEKMGGNRMGLVLFAGNAYLQMPLTTDLNAARLYISNANPDAVPAQGTEIGQALSICNASLDTREKKYKTIILITDGESHDEKVGEAIKNLQESGVVVQTIGIGSPEGAPIFDAALNDFKKDENGNTVVSKLNEKELQEIAEKTGGKYFLFSNADMVSNGVMTAIDQMEKKQTGGGGVRNYNAYFQWFLLASFLLLLFEIFIPERKMKKV